LTAGANTWGLSQSSLSPRLPNTFLPPSLSQASQCYVLVSPRLPSQSDFCCFLFWGARERRRPTTCSQKIKPVKGGGDVIIRPATQETPATKKKGFAFLLVPCTSLLAPRATFGTVSAPFLRVGRTQPNDQCAHKSDL
jgi:hypothetical protein